MSIKVHFPGNKKVHAESNGFTIETDQPLKAGGDGTAPAPFELFLASLATCAGIYVKSFCDARSLDSTGITIDQSIKWDSAKNKIGEIIIDIKVPEDFPEKYHEALIRSADQCAVKKTIQDPPEFEVKVSNN